MENQFKVGDVVRLKSGSPAMVIRGIDGKKIHCVWFSKSSFEYKYEDFYAEVLTLAGPDTF